MQTWNSIRKQKTKRLWDMTIWVCASNMQNTAGDCPSQKPSQQQECFWSIQARVGCGTCRAPTSLLWIFQRCFLTSAHSDIFQTFFQGGVYEKSCETLQTFAFSRKAPPRKFRTIFGRQCMSESSFRCSWISTNIRVAIHQFLLMATPLFGVSSQTVSLIPQGKFPCWSLKIRSLARSRPCIENILS